MQALEDFDRFLEEKIPRLTMALKGSALLFATSFMDSDGHQCRVLLVEEQEREKDREAGK